MTTNLFLFDFDGVLVDSAKDLAVTAYNALNNQDTKITPSYNALPAEYSESFQLLHHKARNAAEIQLLADWIVEEHTVEYEEHKSLILKTDDDYEALQNRFFSARRLLIEQYRDDWCQLIEPIAELCTALENIPVTDRYIVTNKNLDAVLTICSYHKLDIPDENVRAIDTRKSKAQRIEQILTEREEVTAQSSIHFIDDSFTNLREISEHLFEPYKVNLHHAIWLHDQSSLKELQTNAYGVRQLNLAQCINLISSN